MRTGSKWPSSVTLELQGRQIVMLFLGSAFFIFLVFIGGLALGKKLSTPPKASAEELGKKHLDCLDWYEDYLQKKSIPSNSPESEN